VRQVISDDIKKKRIDYRRKARLLGNLRKVPRRQLRRDTEDCRTDKDNLGSKVERNDAQSCQVYRKVVAGEGADGV